MKQFFPKLLLALAAVAVSIATGELFARQIYKGPWHERLLGQPTHDPYKSNPNPNIYGLRGPDHQNAVGKRKRIFFLGDSFTFGNGVPDQAVFPALLQERYNLLRLEGVDGIDVLNGGLSGSMTDEWVELWDKVAPQFKPDVVVIVFFLRDGTKYGFIREFFDTVRREITERNQKSAFYRWSYLVRIYRDEQDRREISEKHVAGFFEGYFGKDQSEWKRTKKRLKHIRKQAKQMGAQVGFVVFPVLIDLDQNYMFKPVTDFLQNYGENHGFKTLNLLPFFLGKNAPDLWVSPYDQHPNEQGHAIAAEALYPFVTELLLESWERDKAKAEK